MQRTASAVWNGTLREGNGTFSAASGVLKDVGYTWAMRFGDAAGTNPEELVAAAHAACFSMSLSGKLTAASIPPEYIRTTATVTMEKLDAGFTVTASHLQTTVRAPGATAEAFAAAAEAAKATCPISRLLNAKITLDASLE